MPRRIMAVLKATAGPTFYYEGIPNKESGGCILGNSVLDASLSSPRLHSYWYLENSGSIYMIIKSQSAGL